MKCKILSLMLALAMVLALTGCTGSNESNTAMTLVGVSLSGTADTNPYGKALEQKLTEVGYSVEVAYAGDGDQVSQITDMVNDSAALLIVEPQDGDSVKKALESISVDVSAVPVITIDSPISSDIIRTHVGIDYEELGKQEAQYIADTLMLAERDEEDEPLTIEFVADKSGCAEKALAGAMSVLQDYVDDETLKILSGNTTAESIETADISAWASDLFTSTYADTNLNAVLCFTPDEGVKLVDTIFTNYTGTVFPLIASADDSAEAVTALTNYYLGMMTIVDADEVVNKTVDAVNEIVSKSDTVAKEQPVVMSAVTLDNYKEILLDSGLFTANEDETFSKN